MKLSSLKPGMTVYSLSRCRMGNTTLMTTLCYEVKIVSVYPDDGYVVASWNGNPDRIYYPSEVKGWRKSKPVLVRNALGACRVATKADKLAMELGK